MAMNRALQMTQRLGVVGLILASLGACQIFDRAIVYEDARETEPLKVPDDLRVPVNNPALAIPNVDGLAAETTTAPPSLGATAAVARGGLPRSTKAVLQLTDEASNTWRRVGIALNRSGCCRVVDKDESGLSYEVELSAAAPKKGFFKRWFGGNEASSVMRVQVETADDGSRVSVVGADGETRQDDAALTVLGVVESRLQ